MSRTCFVVEAIKPSPLSQQATASHSRGHFVCQSVTAFQNSHLSTSHPQEVTGTSRNPPGLSSNMPRQLPWKVGGAATKQTPSRTIATASPAPSASRSPAPSSHRPTPTPKPESTPGPSRKARRSLGLVSGIFPPSTQPMSISVTASNANLPARSPSTSPPPEPLKEE